MVDSHPKDLPFLLKPVVLIVIESGRLFFYAIIFLAFGSWRPCSFIFLSFDVFSVRTSYCTILANGGGSLALLDYLWYNLSTKLILVKEIEVHYLHENRDFLDLFSSPP